jgi:hypothetical protein
MRTLPLVVLACSILIASASAEEVDFTRFAPGERAQLNKCFSDMLTVVKRHNLRGHLVSLLEAGCAAEMRDYRVALRPHWTNESQRSQTEEFFANQATEMRKFSQLLQSIGHRLACQGDCMKFPTSGTTMLIASMEQAALRRYKDQPVSFCSGDACVLDAYSKCLLLQIPAQITRRTKPRVFEKVAQQECMSTENTARVVLTIDFANAQKLQQSAELGENTRELIEAVIRNIRHEIVVSYAEDLTKVQPGRQSCKTAMCGDTKCISLEQDSEYKCAIAD